MYELAQSAGGTVQQAAAPQSGPDRFQQVISGVIALAGLGFAAFLFVRQQPGVGAAVATAIITHYFTQAGGQQTASAALSAVATAGRLLLPPQPTGGTAQGGVTGGGTDGPAA